MSESVINTIEKNEHQAHKATGTMISIINISVIAFFSCITQGNGFSTTAISINGQNVYPRCRLVLCIQKDDINSIDGEFATERTTWTGKRSNDNINTRRLFLLSSTTAITSIILPSSAHAMMEDKTNGISEETILPSDPLPVLPQPTSKRKKPFAPLQALLPASRVRLTIDNALAVSNQMIELDNSYKNLNNVNAAISITINSDTYKSKKNDMASMLEEIILQREQRGFMIPFSSFVSQNSSGISSNTTKLQLLNKKSNTKLYDETYKEKINNLSSPTEIPLALLSQAGDKRQFNILQQRQRRLESKSPIRQALNYYTRQLVFNTETYVLNANAETKKQMIRNNSLPDIQSVIVSDLDLRDLVRNQILDAYDDVRAELQYQLKNNEDFDATELRELLLRAQKECNEWFGFIEDSDVQEAMDVVIREVEGVGIQ